MLRIMFCTSNRGRHTRRSRRNPWYRVDRSERENTPDREYHLLTLAYHIAQQFRFLNCHVGMKRRSAKSVPRFLRNDHKRNHVTASKECLRFFKSNPDEFCVAQITKETLIHRNTSEAQAEGNMVDFFKWIRAEEVFRKNSKITISELRKFAFLFFWCTHELIGTRFHSCFPMPPHIPASESYISLPLLVPIIVWWMGSVESRV